MYVSLKINKRLNYNRLANRGCRLEKWTRDSSKIDSQSEDIGSKVDKRLD